MKPEEIKNIWEFLLYASPFVFTWGGMQIKSWYINYRSMRYKLIWHSLFLSLDNSIREINRWTFKENRKVFKDALEIKLKIWHNQGKVLAEDLDKKKKLGNTFLEYLFIEWMNKTVDLYTKEWKDAKIPNEVIARINKEHELKVLTFTAEINRICHNDDAYPTMKSKSISIFDALKHLLAETKNDFTTLIYRTNYNGNMKGVYYNDIAISDIDYELDLLKKKK